MELEKIKQAHDRFFRESMERIEIAVGLIQLFMNPGVLKNILFNSSEIVKDDWVDEYLKESRSDICYRAKFLNLVESIYFLFEHKSTLDFKTPRQIFRYMSKLWDELEKQNLSIDKIPVVVSFIVYNGKEPWNISNSMKPLFAIIEGVEKYIPDFESVVIDLSIFDEQKIQNNVALKAMLIALKYSRSPEIFSMIPVIIRMLSEVGERENDYLKVVLFYIGAVIPRDTTDEFLEIIRQVHKDGAIYMETVADGLREEGAKRERERLQGEIEKMKYEVEATREKEYRKEMETVQRMLKNGIGIELIHKVTELPIEQIEDIRKKIDR